MVILPDLVVGCMHFSANRSPSLLHSGCRQSWEVEKTFSSEKTTFSQSLSRLLTAKSRLCLLCSSVRRIFLAGRLWCKPLLWRHTLIVVLPQRRFRRSFNSRAATNGDLSASKTSACWSAAESTLFLPQYPFLRVCRPSSPSSPLCIHLITCLLWKHHWTLKVNILIVLLVQQCCVISLGADMQRMYSL